MYRRTKLAYRWGSSLVCTWHTALHCLNVTCDLSGLWTWLQKSQGIENRTCDILCFKGKNRTGIPFTNMVITHLTHWGRVTHICVSKLAIIGSDNGLSPGRRPAIIWTNAGILSIRTLGTNFSQILGKIHSFSFKEMHFKMSSAKGRLFSLGLNELIYVGCNHSFIA